MINSPLNRTNARQILRMFDICFKQGVLDAYEFSDDYGAREFYDQHKAEWDFARLGDADDYDAEIWRFLMYRWARKNSMKQFSESYIYKVTRKNYLWCFLPYCMRFYLMGIDEWLSYPYSMNIELFKNEKNVHWRKMDKGESRKMDKGDFIAYMHEFALDYRRLPEYKKFIATNTMDGYCKAIFALTRKYTPINEIGAEEEEEFSL